MGCEGATIRILGTLMFGWYLVHVSCLKLKFKGIYYSEYVIHLSILLVKTQRVSHRSGSLDYFLA
jgi:hypothetical protein